MKIDIAVYGAGGFGREVAWLLTCCSKKRVNYEVVCFIDDQELMRNRRVNAIPVLSLEAAAEQFPGAAVVGGVGAPALRQRLMERARDRGFRFETIVHPQVELSDSVELGNGSLICAGNILTTNITLGEQVQINLNCTVGHDVVMGDYATLAPGVHVSGWVVLGKRAYVGTGAVIVNGTMGNPIVIGDDAVIGAGACVTKSVAAGVTAVGVPAKPIGT